MTVDNNVKGTKRWFLFLRIDEFLMNFMFWFFFISVIAMMILLDWMLKPEMKSVQDEGIYFGFLLISVLVSVFNLWMYTNACHITLKIIFNKEYKYYYRNE
jgi:hypothetical protein